jgi:hypothetical protein
MNYKNREKTGKCREDREVGICIKSKDEMGRIINRGLTYYANPTEGG